MYNTNINEISRWFTKNKRQMPWRDTKDPYKIWLSETMLQQTQVKTVIPYYKKWVSNYPTILDVASAEENSLLKAWEGLGYYRRCRNFHKASIIVTDSYNGRIPDNYDTFKSLPGVGDYTASAVMSIVFGLPYSVLDANVWRVMCRYLGIKNITVNNKNRIRTQLNHWIKQSKNPGDFNQAMMEIGSQACSIKKPKCNNCPINQSCKAFQFGEPEAYPKPVKKKGIPTYDVSVGIIWDKDKFFIQKREKQNHLGGLWELPGGKRKVNEKLEKTLQREINEECGVKVKVGDRAGFVKHQYSHFKIKLTAFHCSLKNGSTMPATKSSNWIIPGDVDLYPFPKATLKIFDQALT
ncbi:MAG: A/G-specific adenine glycosylase [Candidatus Marinimicrobia bacterium]|jgi:A/G-specific adenine glycosylase|nr:A/G-specific adenine glycosylase [Candidatus Neomarinimicrobiota bacterium]MDP6789127.1 A/G-specific adenine glycosylase [Candidatus Neomarinimicrobiota bacterium]